MEYIIKKLKKDYYGVVDFYITDNGKVELLNKFDRIIAIIEETELENYIILAQAQGD